MDEFQRATAARLAAFLSLHALLRPARPDDHDNLTFAPLALPLRLQDEVRATDILRIARMYDDLSGGGEAGHAVLVALAAPGDDEEERVHRLLALLGEDEPDATPEGSALDAQSTVPEPPQSVADLDLETTPEGSVFDPQRTPVVATVGLAFDAPRGVTLNFLQADELADEGEPAFAAEVETPVTDMVVSRCRQAGDAGRICDRQRQKLTQSSRQSVSMDWAEHDDDDSAARLAAALGAETPEEPAADAIVEAVVVAVEGLEVAEPASEDSGERRKRKPRPRAAGKGKPADKDKVDEEGFEVKTARRASAARGRGRGGRGRGAPREGRQGEPRESGERSRKPAAEKEQNGGQRRPPRKDAPKDKPKEAKPKPSIYKAVQPGAPASAPIL